MEIQEQELVPVPYIIKMARKKAGLTQKELAARLETTDTVISAYENGHTNPTVGMLQRIVNSCGMHLKVDICDTSLDEPGLLERQAKTRRIMRLRAEAHAEAERLHGKPRVMPGFQEAVLDILAGRDRESTRVL